jgi:hypothetical protein
MATGLKIYTQANTGYDLSQDGTFTNPLQLAINGRVGGVIERKFYVRNDKETSGYSSISLLPVDGSGRNIIDGTDGYSWKLRVGDTQPTFDEWTSISPGNTITFEDIDTTDISTYLPFWLRVEIPMGATVESFNDVILRLTATETT